MSDKEYRIERSGDYIKISEVTHDYDPPPPEKVDPSLTFREKIGFGVRGWSQPAKIALTLLFDIYGIVHRWSSNSGLAYLISLAYGFLQIVLMSLFILIPVAIGNDFSQLFVLIKEMWGEYGMFSFAFLIPVIFWLTDIICVLSTGDIRLFGHIFYKDIK